MSRLRVACVGSGFIAGRHLGALSGFGDVEIVAVADAVPERAEEIAGRYGARPYGDGLDLLGAEDLDAVWLCVPPFVHGPLESAAVSRGLPFFVEKPLAADLETARQIAREVVGAGLVTAVGYHWRHLAAVRRAGELLRDRRPHLVTGHWLDRTPPPPWWSRRAASGGQVLEQTTHIFDLARHLAGEVETVTALEVPGTAADVPAAATALLAFRSGAVGTISSARVLGWRHRAGLELVADGRVVELCERSLTDHELRVTDGSGQEQVVRSDEDPIAREDREFLDVLSGRAASVTVPYAEGLRSHALAWAADLSAREGRPVRPAEEER
jgi:myo-inositol 2-dehydrogenase/D-chiro-inositol 1-dehydrogenase